MRPHHPFRWTARKVLVCVLLVLGDWQWAPLLGSRPSIGVEGGTIVAYNQQIVNTILPNSTIVQTAQLNIAVQCLSGESEFFQTIEGSVLENVFLNCTPTEVVFGVILARWVSFKFDTYKVRTCNVCLCDAN